MKAIDCNSVLSTLFKEAKTNGGPQPQYIFTLLRVTGITRQIDPMIKLKESIEKINNNQLDEKNFFKEFQALLKIKDSFELLLNLTNCSNQKPYDPFPFISIRKGTFPHFIDPSLSEQIQFLITIIKENKNQELEKLINELFPDKFIELIEKDAVSEVGYLKESCVKIKVFFESLLDIYKNALFEFKGKPRLYKLPRFEVLELQTSEEQGLYGFMVHFSNGSSAQFIRTIDTTDCLNITPQKPISFNVGLIDALTDEWRIGTKRLYEIGLPGRYNKPGEWKPLVYQAKQGKTDEFQREACVLSNDPDVQGTLFYMMCTGHRVLEFIVTATLDLPFEHSSLGNNFHLWKCPTQDYLGSTHPNIHIYDGWIDLEKTDSAYIKEAIDSINIAINRIVFIYGAVAKWRIKYSMAHSIGGCSTPTEEDMEILNNSLNKFPLNEDAFILDSAIDWFNHGKTSSNIFTKFLCYYIAVESIVMAVTDGNGDFGLGYSKESKAKRIEHQKKCIEERFENLYKEDPIKFVREAYFECYESIRTKTERIMGLVFGEKHEFLKKLFVKENGVSLYDIRGALAHGKYSHLEEEKRHLVGRRIVEIEQIARHLIYRLNFRLKPEENIPHWSQLHAMACSTADPRATLFVSDERIIPNTDWRIRPEWCE
jgi:hypothetical protein